VSTPRPVVDASGDRRRGCDKCLGQGGGWASRIQMHFCSRHLLTPAPRTFITPIAMTSVYDIKHLQVISRTEKQALKRNTRHLEEQEIDCLRHVKMDGN
jgi:hypothetical protein